jgi:hypothetical protein
VILPLGEHDRPPPLPERELDVMGNELAPGSVAGDGPEDCLNRRLLLGDGQRSLSHDQLVLEGARRGLRLGIDDMAYWAQLHRADGMVSVSPARRG